MKKRMFKMNTIALVLLSFMIFSSFNCYAATLTQKIYAADGRSVIVREDYVETYLECGWYLEPMSTLYDKDGNTKVVKTSEVESYIKDGWYAEPVQILYNMAGNTMVYAKKNVDEAIALGWHTQMPTTLMYAIDDRTLDVPVHQVDDYLAVGWYTEPVDLLYNVKGESAVFPKKDLEEALANGWYTQMPMTTIYAIDGRTAEVPTYQVPDYKACGWYTEPMITLYAVDNSTTVVPKSELESYQEKGWYTYPVAMLYNSKGQGVVFDKNDVEWAVKDGWSVTMPKTKIYSLDGRVAEVPINEVSAYQKLGWYDAPVKRLYNYNGESKIFSGDEINSKLAQGWTETMPMVTLYSLDGRIINVSAAEGVQYKKSGWYAEPSTKLYNRNGKTKVVPLYEATSYRSSGYYPYHTYIWKAKSVNDLTKHFGSMKYLGYSPQIDYSWFASNVYESYSSNKYYIKFDLTVNGECQYADIMLKDALPHLRSLTDSYGYISVRDFKDAVGDYGSIYSGDFLNFENTPWASGCSFSQYSDSLLVHVDEGYYFIVDISSNGKINFNTSHFIMSHGF